MKLNWDRYGQIYLYGCHTAAIDSNMGIYPLQELATNQGVVAFGNYYYAQFSSNVSVG